MEVQLALALPEGLEVTGMELRDEVLTITAVSTQRQSCCPLCGVPAWRVHSRCTRQIADVPCGGQRVRLRVLVRKWFCQVTACARKIFAERLTPFVAPWARVTARLFQVVQTIGLATGGMLGARLAKRIGIHTSWMTILRRIMALPGASVNEVAQLGIDDFAFRRGRNYGTILVDLLSHQVLDLLPDRTVETAAAWMQAHPEIELVSRDRGEDYAAAARLGAPQATQVADRFHLAKNLTEIVEVVLARCRAEIRQTTQPTEGLLKPEDEVLRVDWKPKAEPVEQEARLARLAERQVRYQQMLDWYAQGLPTKDMARRLGVTTRTIQHWIKRGVPYGKPRRKRRSCFDPYAEAALALWQNGAASNLQIWQALQTQGFQGSYRTVHRFLESLPEYSKHRVGDARRAHAIPDHPLQQLQAREAVWWFVRDPHDLDRTAHATLQALLQASPTAQALYPLVQEFLSLLRQRKGERLEAWLEKVRGAQIAELSRLARSIERDKAAVLAGLTLPQNNGVVEGKVNQLKLLKRMMYGRAAFPLLRQRVLHAL